MISTIFFDFDGVLTTDKNGWYTTCKNIQKTIPKTKLQSIIDCYLKHTRNLSRGEISHQEMWPDFCDCVGENIDINILPQALANAPKNEKMLGLCKRLGQTYRLGIITDNNLARFNLLKTKWGLSRLFKVICLSAEQGALKTDQDLFEKALELAGVKAKDSVFIDNHEKNLTIPRQMGFKTFWHDHEKNDINLLVTRLQAWGIKI